MIWIFTELDPNSPSLMTWIVPGHQHQFVQTFEIDVLVYWKEHIKSLDFRILDKIIILCYHVLPLLNEM